MVWTLLVIWIVGIPLGVSALIAVGALCTSRRVAPQAATIRPGRAPGLQCEGRTRAARRAGRAYAKHRFIRSHGAA